MQKQKEMPVLGKEPNPEMTGREHEGLKRILNPNRSNSKDSRSKSKMMDIETSPI